MGRCLHHLCTSRAFYGVQGNKPASYCKKHAEDGMLNVGVKRCSEHTCSKTASFNFLGSKIGIYCAQHATDGMVNVLNRRCAHDTCLTVPSFNLAGKRIPIYCKQHAHDGMVNVRSKHCSHDSCTTIPFFNVEGTKKGKYCKQHAEEGMVDVYSNRCLHSTCTRGPYFNSKGSKTAAYCRLHAKDGMVDVRSKYCLHDSCTTFLPSMSRAARPRSTASGMLRSAWSTSTPSAVLTMAAQGKRCGAYCQAEQGLHALNIKATSWTPRSLILEHRAKCLDAGFLRRGDPVVNSLPIATITVPSMVVLSSVYDPIAIKMFVTAHPRAQLGARRSK